ncbi:MAG: nucleoside hydrolase [Micavibrio sp.]
MTALQIHYDCDPGQDDAIALLFALGAGVDVKSISIVGGNVDVDKCTRNALQILEFTNRSAIPVYKGAPQPLKRLSQPLPDVFGECGMAGANLPAPEKREEAKSGAEFLATLAIPQSVVATGPLTNLAQAIQDNPAFAGHVKRLYIMGGCVYPEHLHGHLGNIQVKGSEGWAEYNFAVDPDAAKIVFAAGIEEIFLIPLEVTRTILYRYDVDQKLRAQGGKAASLAADILSTVGPEDRIDYAAEMADAGDPVRAMHDVVAMAYLTDPEIFKTERMPIRIEDGAPPLPAGQTIIDENNPDHPSVTVIRDLDRARFIELLVRYMGELS